MVTKKNNHQNKKSRTQTHQKFVKNISFDSWGKSSTPNVWRKHSGKDKDAN